MSIESHDGMIFKWEKGTSRDKPVPVLLCLPQIPKELYYGHKSLLTSYWEAGLAITYRLYGLMLC
jgi:hypothetical protein